MQKHWYIIYTKAKCEKKVSGLLTRKKIKNFCPIHSKQVHHDNKMKLIYEPLFSSYIFVYINECEINQVKQLNHIINVVYWKDHPTVIPDQEIEKIREFVEYYRDIQLERSKVHINSYASIVDRPSYSVIGNIVVIKNKFIKVNLPSLGYVMIAKIEGKGVIGRGALNNEIGKFWSSLRS